MANLQSGIPPPGVRIADPCENDYTLTVAFILDVGVGPGGFGGEM